MRKLITLFSLFCCIAFTQTLSAQGTGVIIRPAGLTTSQSVLDAGATGYTSKTSAGFLGDDVANSRLPFKPIPAFSNEPFGDLRRGPNHLYSDFVPDPNGSGVYVYCDGTNLLFRMRLGSIVPGAKGYSILIDTDGKFGATGANADPNYQAATTGTNGNPGFEIEVDLFTQNSSNPGVAVYNVDGTSTPGAPVQSYNDWTKYSQVSIAGTADNGDPDFFLDFFIPLSDLASLGVTSGTPLRMNATTVMAPQPAVGGPKSDIYGVDDSGYKSVNAEYEAYINAQPSFTPTSLNNTSTASIGNMCTAAPTLNTPISTGATSVSGTWTKSQLTGAASTATIKIYKNGTYTGQSASVTSGSAWTVTGLSALASNDVITAKALATGESECLSSNAVTVSSCNSATKPATPVLACNTFSKGLTGTNRGSTNSVLWVVHVDNLSTNDLRNSTTDQSNAYFSNMSGANWDFSAGCQTGSQMTAGSYKIYYTDNTGCNSEPLFVCVSPGKANTNVAGTLNVPTITSPTGSVFTTATKTIAGTTQATTNGTSMTLYVDNYPVATTTASSASPYSFSFTNLNLLQGQTVYITNEYNTGTQSTSYCPAKTSAFTVTCFTSVPMINTDANGQLVAGTAITGTSSEPAGTVINVYTSTGTLVSSPAVGSNGTWTTGSYTALAGASYYANATNGSCGVSGNSATVSAPSSVTSSARCGTINGGLTSSSLVSGTISGSSASPIAAGTKVNVYEDGTNIGTYTFSSSSTNSAAPWSITINTGTLYSGGVITIGIREGGTAGEVVCSASTTVSCTPPLTPLYTQQSSNGTSGSSATVPPGGTMTYTITNLAPTTFYSIADAATGKAYSAGAWTGSTTTAGETITVTTYPLTTTGSYNGVLKATSVSSTDMCSAMAAASTFTVLPVTFLNLSAAKNGNGLLLTWAVTNEQNVSHYEVEKSLDCRNFSLLAKVDYKPTTAAVNTYSLPDNVINGQRICYRIKQVDKDGHYHYSSVIQLSANATTKTMVAPNPATDNLSINMSSQVKEKAIIQLLDISGRVVYETKTVLLPGTNSIGLSGLQQFARGQYVLKLSRKTAAEYFKIVLQ